MANNGSVVFEQSELKKYQKRYFRFLRVCEAQGLQIKITGIRCDAGPMDDTLVERVEAHIQQQIPAAANKEGDHHGLGFAVLHEGLDAIWLLMHWWAHGEICCQKMSIAQGTGSFETAPASFHACVWEHIAINHEHQAWIRNMLNGAPEPGNYLSDVLPSGQY